MSSKVFDVVTKNLLELIEELPEDSLWETPWNHVQVHLLANAHTGRLYHGLNVWNLFFYTLKYKCEYGAFMASSSIFGKKAKKDKDGKNLYSLKKGTKAAYAIFWVWPTPQQMKEYETAVESGKNVRKPTPYALYHTLFNIGDVIFADAEEEKTLKDKYSFVKDEDRKPFAEDGTIENILKSWKTSPELLIQQQNRACYIPNLDAIILPTPQQFKTAENYYRTMLHEIGHSTGHFDRLNRVTGMASVFGTSEYAEEELIAELFASYMSAILHLNGEREEDLQNNSARYIKNWKSRIRENPKAFVYAAQNAQKAVNFALQNAGEKYKEYVSNNKGEDDNA